MKFGWFQGEGLGRGRLHLALSEACFAFVTIVALSGSGFSAPLMLGLVAVWIIHALLVLRFLQDSASAAHNLVQAKDAADRATLTRGAFLSTMSHEIRTPMNAVLGMTGLLRSTRLDAQQQEFAKAIEDSANALLGIVNDVLDFSKIDVGKMDIAVIEFDLVEVVEGSVDVLSFKAREKHVRLFAHVDSALPARWMGDSGRIRQILLNLLGNALKFTNAGEVSLKVYPMRAADVRHRIRFEVRDTGIGMDGETIDRLFSPFSQADSSVTRKYGGTGLGLSICKHLVELMGGKIGVESVPDAGSCFWFELGLPAAHDSGRYPDRNQPQATGNPMRVVLIEPHDGCAAMLQDYLRDEGVPTIRYHKASDALSGLQATPHSPGAVIVSSEVADMTVATVLARFGRAYPAARCFMLDHKPNLLDRGEKQQWPVLQLPFKRQHLLQMLGSESAAQISPAAAPMLLTNPGHEEILLVEDNVMNQKVALYQLSAMGHAVDIADNGAEALEKLKLRKYRLILMDCQMPVLDGYETTRRIRQFEGADARTPIVAMTANAMAGDREHCLAAGMDDYLTKPLLREQLASVLEKFMPSQQAASPPMIIDEARLLELFGDDEQLAQEMLSLFIEHTAPIIDDIDRAGSLGEIPIVEMAALGHRLAGSCLNLGAQALGELGRQIEGAARQGNQEQVRSLSKQCALAFKDLRQRVSNRGPGKT